MITYIHTVKLFFPVVIFPFFSFGRPFALPFFSIVMGLSFPKFSIIEMCVPVCNSYENRFETTFILGNEMIKGIFSYDPRFDCAYSLVIAEKTKKKHQVH